MSKEEVINTIINTEMEAMIEVLRKRNVYESEAEVLSILRLNKDDIIKIVNQSDVKTEILKEGIEIRFNWSDCFLENRNILCKDITNLYFKQSFYELMETGKVKVKNNEDRNKCWKTFVVNKIEKEFKRKKDEILNHYTVENMFLETENIARTLKAKKLINKYDFTIKELIELYDESNPLINVVDLIQEFEEEKYLEYYYDYKLDPHKNIEENLIDFIKENLNDFFENLG